MNIKTIFLIIMFFNKNYLHSMIDNNNNNNFSITASAQELLQVSLFIYLQISIELLIKTFLTKTYLSIAHNYIKHKNSGDTCILENIDTLYKNNILKQSLAIAIISVIFYHCYTHYQHTNHIQLLGSLKYIFFLEDYLKISSSVKQSFFFLIMYKADNALAYNISAYSPLKFSHKNNKLKLLLNMHIQLLHTIIIEYFYYFIFSKIIKILPSSFPVPASLKKLIISFYITYIIDLGIEKLMLNYCQIKPYTTENVSANNKSENELRELLGLVTDQENKTSTLANREYVKDFSSSYNLSLSQKILIMNISFPKRMRKEEFDKELSPVFTPSMLKYFLAIKEENQLSAADCNNIIFTNNFSNEKKQQLYNFLHPLFCEIASEQKYDASVNQQKNFTTSILSSIFESLQNLIDKQDKPIRPTTINIDKNFLLEIIQGKCPPQKCYNYFPFPKNFEPPIDESHNNYADQLSSIFNV